MVIGCLVPLGNIHLRYALGDRSNRCIYRIYQAHEKIISMLMIKHPSIIHPALPVGA